MATFLHGVQIQEIDSGTKVVRTASSSVIGLIGTAENSTLPLNTSVLIKSKKEAGSLGNTGALADSVNSIFDQIGAVIVAVRVDSEETENTTVTDNIIAGMSAFLAAESTVHVKPRILIAPTFSSDSEVVSAMIPIAEKLKAVIIADGPNTTDTDAVGYAENIGNPRVYVVDPWLKIGNKVLPPSPFVAGLIAKTDNEKGFWHSPSNQEILGITGLARPIDFSFGDENCSANYLNENNVATVIHQDGYRLWGNRTTASDSKWAFLSVRRTADIINDSLLRAHLWAVDRNITKTYLEDVAESVNAYLATLKAQGAILGGVCYPSGELNSAANIQDGKAYFDFEFTPPYPAESITFRSYLTNEYINEII